MASEKLGSLSFQEAEHPLPENEQVAIALRPRTVSHLLEQAFGLNISSSVEPTSLPGIQRRPLACHILDTKYEPGDYCMVLYQLGDHLAIGIFNWSEAESHLPETTKIIPSLGMQAYLFPYDPALPSLIKALDPAAISAALAQALPEIQTGAARILRSRVTVLRFRPGRRCTVRLDVWLRNQESGVVSKRVYFGKIYHDLEKARNVFQEMQSLSSSIPMRDGRIALATASLFLPDLAMVLQDPIEGVPLDAYLNCGAAGYNPQDSAGIVQAAAALAALHTSGLAAGRMRPIKTELSRFKKRANKIGLVNPTLAQEIIALVDTLAGWLDSLDQWGATVTLVHGDCKPSQFLISHQQVALIDFDHCGMADPAGDVGTFLATLQQLKVKTAIKHHGSTPRCTDWMPELKQQFLDAYCAASGYAPSFQLRAGWYEAVGLLRKAIRSFERSPFSPVSSALVAEAFHSLEALPPPGEG
jgi:hypothetical protein